MGDRNGEPIYCPLCGTLPSAIEDPQRICPSCDMSMKAIKWIDSEQMAAIQRVLEEVQAVTSPYGAIADDLIAAMIVVAKIGG